MLDRRDVTLCYDGTPDGLMSVIFYCYEHGVMPFSVITDKGLSLMPVERVLTDVRKADRVINGIKKAAGQASQDPLQIGQGLRQFPVQFRDPVEVPAVLHDRHGVPPSRRQVPPPAASVFTYYTLRPHVLYISTSRNFPLHSGKFYGILLQNKIEV